MEEQGLDDQTIALADEVSSSLIKSMIGATIFSCLINFYYVTVLKRFAGMM